MKGSSQEEALDEQDFGIPSLLLAVGPRGFADMIPIRRSPNCLMVLK